MDRFPALPKMALLGLIGLALLLTVSGCQPTPAAAPPDTPPTSEKVTNTSAPSPTLNPSATPAPTSSPIPTRMPATETPLPSPTPTRNPPPPPITAPGQGYINPIDGAEMVGVPAGEFVMGRDNPGKASEGPAHTVYLDAFYIDKYEITNTQYRACLEAGGCPQIRKTNYFDDPTLAGHPVVNVTIDWARQYCRWAGKRLPTEAEWEKAARGTDERTYPWGEDLNCDRAQYLDCGGETVPVGSKPAGVSPYGAHDMAGNVWEWTSDLFLEDYYQVSPERNPTGGERGNEWVFRGGSWTEEAPYLRSTYRTWYNPNAQYYNLGFRCVKTPR